MASNSSLNHLAEKVDGRESIESVPDHGFRVRLNHKFAKKGKPFFAPRLHQLPSFIGLSFRYMVKWNKIRKQGKKMFIDIRDAVPLQQIYGVPLGGIGCGSIGRGFKGEFGRFQMIPGMYKWKTIPGDQFIVTIRKNDKTVYQQVLSSHKAPTSQLSAWKWEFDGSQATYHGLYPRSWTVYNIPEHGVKLTCRQISPVIPHEYQESCLPVGVFVWKVENHSSEELDVSITFTFQGSIGRKRNDEAGGVWNKKFASTDEASVRGVSINQKLNDMNCSFMLAGKQTDTADVSQCTYFDPGSDGSSLWNQLEQNGELSDSTNESKETTPGQLSGAAICIKTKVKAKSAADAELCLAWHMPVVRFGSGAHRYHRRYARWYGGESGGEKLCSHALSAYHDWEKLISDWQQPVLRSKLPSWYKSAIFNELYFVSDGGSVWLDVLEDKAASNGESFNRLAEEYGKFAYLEGHEYRMYNTYDVHFYASYALIMNWPKLQLSLQYDMAEAIGTSVPTMISYITDGKMGPIKEQHCVPHDIGDPEDEPWSNINSYNMHPTNDWKDLNSKFVLQVMRDYHVTNDKQYMEDMFPTVLAVMKRSLQFDTDDDGMIENSGYADQTYDTWTATGTSAYCGSLWIAALRSVVSMCRVLEKPEHEEYYQQLLNKASKAFDTKLWNGEYYNYDSSKSTHHKHIMSDQLCGHWYLKSCGITDEQVFPTDKVKSALRKIFEYNVQKFGGGQMGAINGCKPDGSADRTTVQSEEFWTGVSYALSANFLQMDMLSEAFQTSYGVYREVYEMRGLAYQTPEAYMDNEVYRSLGYMRPLSIWSIQQAIEQYHKELLNGSTVMERCETLVSPTLASADSLSVHDDPSDSDLEDAVLDPCNGDNTNDTAKFTLGTPMTESDPFKFST